MMRKSLLFPIVAGCLGLVAPPVWAVDPPAGHGQVDEEAAAKELAAVCAKVTCRKTSRILTLRMPSNSSFQISTRPLPYLDDKGTLIMFAGESITLSYAADDQKLEHPILSAVHDPLGSVELPPPPSGAAVTFDLSQMDGRAGMMLTVTNTTKVIVKYDAVMFVADPASGGARGRRTTACPVLPPQGNASSFAGFESWPQPIVMMLITNIRALPADASQVCN